MNSEKSHNMVKEELYYLLITKLSLPHVNRDELTDYTDLIDFTKFINTHKQAILTLNYRKICIKIYSPLLKFPCS